MVLFLDRFNLSRFVKRQAASYEGALKEIKSGKKVGCWMWCIFPQIRGLGASRRSFIYGISGQFEARAYLAHPVLGARLRECCEALLENSGKSAEEIFGELDAKKLCSSMTLFACVSGENSIFHKVLASFFGGRRDDKTIALLNQ